MPSKSQAQHNLMAMVANDPAAAKRTGISQSVGKEFVQADKGKKFGKGQENRADLQKVNSPKVNRGANKLFKEGGHVMATKKMMKGGITTAKMGTVKTAAPSRDGVATKGKTKGAQVKMAGTKPLGMKKGGRAC
jgi:hypothetical protein